MRMIKREQMQFGQVRIEDIRFNLKSRDDIPKILMGLQYIYTKKELREEIFGILRETMPEGVSMRTGRPGMELWKVLVMGVLKVSLGWDLDRLLEMLNNHKTIRLMLGHGMMDEDYQYNYQTVKDNIELLNPEVINKINDIVVREGHKIVKKDGKIRGRCDSFVLKTNVHFPTDLNLYWDSLRKVIKLSYKASRGIDGNGWRKWKHHMRRVKRCYRKSQQAVKGKKKPEEKTAACMEYLEVGVEIITKAKNTLPVIKNRQGYREKAEEIEKYIRYSEIFMEQIERRLIKGEKIAHGEKIFSVFKPYTEWIQKGKAGVVAELGVRIGILDDQYGFHLSYRVMHKKTDDKIAVEITEEAKAKYPELHSCSYDKAFYTPENLRKLKEIIPFVVMPKKGRRNSEEEAEEKSPGFIRERLGRSAVESDIHSLMVHGLSVCRDYGKERFHRYVALGILGDDLHKLGAVLKEKKYRRYGKKKKRVA